MSSLSMTKFGLAALHSARERQQHRIHELVAAQASAVDDIRDISDPLAQQQTSEYVRECEKLHLLQRHCEDAVLLHMVLPLKTVQIGSLVTLLTDKQTLHVLVVSSIEARYLPRKSGLRVASSESPVGRVLLGLSAGDTFYFQLSETKMQRMTIQSIESYENAARLMGLAI